MTDRDIFAAAALAGLTHPEDGQAGPLRMELVCTMAYLWADEMLRFRDSRNAKTTNHDAAPAAKAESDEDRTDKAATSHRRDRPGDTHSDRPNPINDARLEALEELSALDQKFELEYGLTGNPMIKAQQRMAAKQDTNKPRIGAVRGPDPDSRVWETQGHAPDSQTTQGECSKPREGT